MKAWLDGDLAGVDPRAEQDLLLQALTEAAEAGQDPTAMVRALADLDAVAAAELRVGPRAPASPVVVRAALQVAPALEDVLPAAGLYRRLIDLAPELRDEVLRAAVVHHGGAPWVWRLARDEVPPGASVLRALAPSGLREAARAALAAGCRRAVVARAAEGEVEVLRLLYDEAPRDLLIAALTGLIDADRPEPVVAWLAAWHGPDVDPLFAAVARRLRTEPGRRRLRGQAADLPETRDALDEVP